ncbi:MAG: glycosyltransferase family 39 protein [Candidatus Doudnabacteria bacterium]
MKKPLVNNIKYSNPTVWLTPILILGALLRFYNNTAVALWHDEAFSALYIRYPFKEMMYRITLDVHPPLYYWVLRLWGYIFGSGLLSLRSLSILFGVLTVYAGYLFVKEAFKNEKLAILAALFLAINPFQIQYSLEARMYTLGTFLILLSSYLLVRALNSNKTSVWIAYAVCVSACFYTHYYLFFSVAAQGLYFLYYLWQQKRFTFNFNRDSLTAKGLGSYLLSLLIFAPWIPTLLVQIKRVEKAFWIPAPDRWSIPGTIWKMAFGGQGNDHITLIITTLVAVAVIIYFFRETKPPVRWLIVLSVAVPFIASLLLSFKQAIYQDRYFVFASLFFTILIAATLFLVPKYTTRRTLTLLFAVFSLIIFFKNWRDLGPIKDKPGMAAASAVVNENAKPTDKIYVGSSFIYFTFKYYNHTPIHPLLYSTLHLKDLPHFSGTALLNEDDLILDFGQAKKGDLVWLLWTTGFGGSKPNVPGTWQKIDEKIFGDTPGFKGDIYVTEYTVN